MVEFTIREYSRTPREAPILLHAATSGPTYGKKKNLYTSGVMHNVGQGGLYFESDRPLYPGMMVSIKVLDPSTDVSEEQEGAYRVHRGKVRWCKTIDRAKKLYGVGVETFETVVQAAVKSKRPH